MYLYLLFNKSEALNAFKIYKAKVEKKRRKKTINIVRSDRYKESYGKYIEKWQMSGPFAKFIKGESIITHYIMAGIPQQNDVIQRRNRTFIKHYKEHD